MSWRGRRNRWTLPRRNQTPAEPGQWLIFDSPRRTWRRLGRAAGDEGPPLHARAGRRRSRSRGGRRCRSFCRRSEPGRRGVVYLSGLDVDGRHEAPDFEAARAARLGRRAWTWCTSWPNRAGPSRRVCGWLPAAPRPWADRPLPLSLAQSPVWGLGRVIASEHPALACTRIDLDPEDRRDAADQLVEELLWGQGEDQVAYRGAQRRVARLRRLRHGEADALETPDGQPYRLEITSRGQLDNVALRPVARQSAGARPGGDPGACHGAELPRRAQRAGPVSRRSRPAGRRVRRRDRRRRRGSGAFQAGRPGRRAGPGQLCQLRPDAGRVRRSRSPRISASRKRPRSPSASSPRSLPCAGWPNCSRASAC